MGKRMKRLIWFAEESWTRAHAVIGIKGEKTLCGVKRSTRNVGRREIERGCLDLCSNCRKVVHSRYGASADEIYMVPG